MEGKKQVGSSHSTSFNDLFGSKESQATSSATGVFASIFQPPSMVSGRYSSNSEMKGSWQQQPSGNQEWNTKKESAAKSGKEVSTSKKDRTTYQEGRTEPCHLSSSLYYGGQDVYSHSSSTQTYGSYPIYKKNGEEDESNGNNSQSASRGNWWEGSLYY